MSDETASRVPLLRRRTTRRALVGATVAAGSVAAAYAALGDGFDVFGGHGTSGTAVVSDTDALKKDGVRISHLLRRAGFGPTREEFDHYQTVGLKQTTDELLSYETVNDDDAFNIANQVPTDGQNARNLPGWWIVRMANTKRPLQEKMTLFWHGLLTSQLSVVRDPVAMRNQNEFFRSHALDTFDSVLRGITMDPAMMVYLDMNGSQKKAPNENYARELMELFSLGVGNYTEDDIRQAARALTGWVVQRQRGAAPNQIGFGQPQFVPARFDDGTKTFLGQTGNFRAEDIVGIIVQQPASSQFIVRKLFSYFVYPNPDDKALRPFVNVYDGSSRSVRAVVDAIFRSDIFYSPPAYRAIVRSPVEYMVSSIRALGIQSQAVQVVARSAGLVQDMGQIPFEPPNVAGWPGGQAWLNSATMFARLNFVNLLTNLPAARSAPPPVAPLGTAQQAVDYYLPFVLDDNVPADARQVLLNYAGSPDAQLAPDQLRNLVYLVMASPQAHLS